MLQSVVIDLTCYVYAQDLLAKGELCWDKLDKQGCSAGHCPCTGFMAENQSLTNWPLCGKVSQLVAQHLHMLATLSQLKFFTVCGQDVWAAELCVEPLIFVQTFCVRTLADSELMPPSPLFL